MKRVIYIVLGSIMLVIGSIGIFLPVLPTTVFLIMAAFFFTHSSDRLYQRLMSNKTFGPIITNYIKYKGITRKDRTKATVTLWVVIGISIVLSQSYLFGSILFLVLILHTVFLYRLNLV